MKCPVCGKENPQKKLPCPHCGAVLSQITPSSPEKPRTKRGFWASIHSLLFRPLWPQKQGPPKKPTSKLAIASLILALLAIPPSPVPLMMSEVVALILRVPGFDALPFSFYMPGVALTLVGLVLGVVAVIKIRRSRGKIAGFPPAVAGAVLSAAFLGWAYFLTPSAGGAWSPNESVATNLPRFLAYRPMGMYQAAANRASCKNNLKQIGSALHIYASKHGGRFPAGPTAVEAFSELVESGAFRERVAGSYVGGAWEVFACPAAWRDYRAWQRTKKLTKESCSYDYVAGLSHNSPPDFILAYDKTPDNHWGMGRNVLFVDGHVEWWREEGFQETLAEQLQKMKSAE